MLMDSVLATLVRKRVRYLLHSLKIEPIEDILGDGSEWILAAKFRDHFEGDKSNIGGRNGKDYPDAYYQEKKGKKQWYIKIEYIPAVVAKLMSSHALPRPYILERRLDFLNKIGFPFPKPIPYLYFGNVINEGLIKIGSTANFLSEKRMEGLKKKYSDFEWWKKENGKDAVIKHDEAKDLETILHNYFSDLNVPIVDGKRDKECYESDEKLTDFIDNLDEDPEKAADQIKHLKSEI